MASVLQPAQFNDQQGLELSVDMIAKSRSLKKPPSATNGKVRPTLPVAPQHASLASSITILRFFALSSSHRNLAADVPLMPEPMMTMSAFAGKSRVVRWPKRNFEGSLCQKEAVESRVGRLAILRGSAAEYEAYYYRSLT